MAKPQTSTPAMESPSRWSTFIHKVWKRLFTSTSKPTRKDLLEVIADQNRQLIRLCEKQQATIDRVIAAKFDAPVAGRVTEQIQRPPVFPEYMLTDVLGAETDEQFFEAADKASA